MPNRSRDIVVRSGWCGVNPQETERRRIARGVHDDSLQAICAVGLGVANLRHLVKDSEATERLEGLQETVRFASRRLRTLLFDLEPGEPRTEALVPALRAYLESAELEESLDFTLDDQLSSAPDREMDVFLFGVVRELVMNVRKHAQASSVAVSLTERNGRRIIRVRDDGVGFDTAEALGHRPGHLGLAELITRVERAGGSLRIESAAGAGSTAEVDVPAAGTPDLHRIAASGPHSPAQKVFTASTTPVKPSV